MGNYLRFSCNSCGDPCETYTRIYKKFFKKGLEDLFIREHIITNKEQIIKTCKEQNRYISESALSFIYV